jgi:TrmH family RNA methyltransferase
MLQERHISSRDNALVKDLRRLAQDSGGLPQAGPGLAGGRPPVPRRAGARLRPSMAVFSESGLAVAARVEYAQAAIKMHSGCRCLVCPTSAGWSRPRPMGFVLDLPATGLDRMAPTVMLDRVQDAGNVGSILRSAAAFGFRQVIASRAVRAVVAQGVARGHGRALWPAT